MSHVPMIALAHPRIQPEHSNAAFAVETGKGVASTEAGSAQTDPTAKGTDELFLLAFSCNVPLR